MIFNKLSVHLDNVAAYILCVCGVYCVENCAELGNSPHSTPHTTPGTNIVITTEWCYAEYTTLLVIQYK
jgi:hypothetical protein